MIHIAHKNITPRADVRRVVGEALKLDLADDRPWKFIEPRLAWIREYPIVPCFHNSQEIEQFSPLSLETFTTKCAKVVLGQVWTMLGGPSFIRQHLWYRAGQCPECGLIVWSARRAEQSVIATRNMLRLFWRDYRDSEDRETFLRLRRTAHRDASEGRRAARDAKSAEATEANQEGL